MACMCAVPSTLETHTRPAMHIRPCARPARPASNNRAHCFFLPSFLPSASCAMSSSRFSSASCCRICANWFTIDMTKKRTRPTTNSSQHVLRGLCPAPGSKAPSETMPSVLEAASLNSMASISPFVFLSHACSTRSAISSPLLYFLYKCLTSWISRSPSWPTKSFSGKTRDCNSNCWTNFVRPLTTKSFNPSCFPATPLNVWSIDSTPVASTWKKPEPNKFTKSAACRLTLTTPFPSAVARKKVQNGIIKYPQHMPHMSKAALGHAASKKTPTKPCFSVKFMVQIFILLNKSVLLFASSTSAWNSLSVEPEARAALATAYGGISPIAVPTPHNMHCTVTRPHNLRKLTVASSFGPVVVEQSNLHGC
mmetsp:Transcript_48652/g.113046  ORF Transcript_48652/g.113046 Transcript_48652/m.113046 type:complete len:366 (-) Transcript_48652:189-1286(-)